MPHHALKLICKKNHTSGDRYKVTTIQVLFLQLVFIDLIDLDTNILI